MGVRKNVNIGEIHVYKDPKNPTTSEYDVVLPVTSTQAVFDSASNKNLIDILNGKADGDWKLYTQEELSVVKEDTIEDIVARMADRSSVLIVTSSNNLPNLSPRNPDIVDGIIEIVKIMKFRCYLTFKHFSSCEVWFGNYHFDRTPKFNGWKKVIDESDMNFKLSIDPNRVYKATDLGCDDFNTLPMGFIRLDRATNYKNSPTGTRTFIGEVETLVYPAYKTQKAYNYDDKRTYIRDCGSGWSQWQNISFVSDDLNIPFVKGGTGYIKFPNGFTIQWGSLNVLAKTLATVNFPITFTINFGVQGTAESADRVFTTLIFGPKSNTGFTVEHNNVGTRIIDWVAFGYITP